VVLMQDKFTGKSRGFAFVTMASDAEAATAITQFNGKTVDGRALTVNEARPREERTGGGGGGYRGGGGGGGQNGRKSGGGKVNLAQGSLRDYARGLSLSDIAAQIEGSEGTLQIKSLTASAAPGKLSMTGTVGVLQSGMPVDLRITAHRAQPIVSALVTSNLDADLRVSGTLRERLGIAGSVHLNRTLIGIPNGLPLNVAVLDVRRRGKTAAPAADKPLVIDLDVTVKAPQEILVQGRGLDAEMGGELHFGGTSAAPVVSGGFDLQRGSFSLASSRLNFTAGRVGFNGLGLRNRIDPTLDFTAQATVALATTVTLRITGLADAPVFEFTSTPMMPQDEIMGYLMFGVPVSQLTPIQLAQIGLTLASLSGLGGDGGLNPLVKLQRSLGLDRLSVGAGTSTTTAATAPPPGPTPRFQWPVRGKIITPYGNAGGQKSDGIDIATRDQHAGYRRGP